MEKSIERLYNGFDDLYRGGKNPMTICIAALCEEGNAVVTASDRMITADFLALQFEHPNPKIEKLAESCVGLTAGDALAHTELFRNCKEYIQVLKTPNVDLIANTIKNQFSELRKKQAEDLLLKPRGLTIINFYKDGYINKIPSDLATVIDRGIIRDIKYPIIILIAGVDKTGAHIYCVSDPGIVNCFDRLGYNAIGSGDRHALYSIIENNHSESKGLNETVFTVYEAKRKAELAPGVGKAIEIVIITSEGIKEISKSEMNQLEAIYSKKVNPSQKDIEESISKLQFK